MTYDKLQKARDRISVEYLRECFRYEEGVLYWKERPAAHFKRPADHATFIKKSAGKPAGRKEPRGYICVKFRMKGESVCISVHHIVWALHHGNWPEQHLDHINRIRDDNRIENLREVTPAENNKNSIKRRIYPYVAPYHHGKFAAQVRIGGEKSVHIGVFDSAEEARDYRQMVCVELEKLAHELAKKTPRPKTYRKRARAMAQVEVREAC
jgi:hypothetical protein